MATRFIDEFTRRKNEILYGKEALDSEYIDRVTDRLVMRDMRIAVRFAILLRDQEWRGYLEKVFKEQADNSKFEL